MFRQVLFVTESKLAKLLWLLDGVAILDGPPQPVHNAIESSDGTAVIAKNPMMGGGIPVSQQLILYLQTHNIKTLKERTDIRPMIEELGGRPAGYSYYWHYLQDKKIVSKQKKKGVYTVNFNKSSKRKPLQIEHKPPPQQQTKGE